MKLVVDTGVFSASLSHRPQPSTSPYVEKLSGNQLFLASVTVVELRFGADGVFAEAPGLTVVE